MELDAKIYVAGHTGLVGSAIMRRLSEAGHTNLITATHDELDLTDSVATRAFYERHKPDHVFVCAAKVGGIIANNTYPADFIHINLAIGTNTIHEAWRSGVKRLIFLGSSCIYPRECPQPMKEEHLLSGPLEPTNRPYAVAKIAGIETCWAFNRQHGTHYLSVMPTNLYGQGDNYDLTTSHVLPALIRKMHEAKVGGKPNVTLWGTGSPRREFLYSEDLADAVVFLANLPDAVYDPLVSSETVAPLINIGYGEELTIRELAEQVKAVVGFEGELVWDTDKPDGTPRKLLDSSRLRALGWQPRVPLAEGIARSYQFFLDEHGA